MSILLRGGTIVDGSGRPAFPGHLLLEQDRIQAIVKPGDPLPPAETVLDVRGRVIAPGFIDMHSHADWLLPLADHPSLLKRLVEQGVTSLVAGNCGISPAPVRAETVKHLESFAAITMERPFAFTWNSLAEFFDRIEENEPVLNLAQLVGHASIRYAAAETRRGRLPPAELEKCLDQARRSLAEGACGLSFGLGYDPGMYSPLDELEAFCRVAAAAGKPVTVHLKAYSRLSPCYPLTALESHNLRALREMLAIARRTGVKLQLSHFIFVGRQSWSSAADCLGLVEDARGQGVDVMVDAFPYTSGNTTIHAPFPYWFLARIPEAYRHPWARARLRLELELGFRLVGFLYRDFQVMDAAVPGWEDLNGLTIKEIAARWGTSPFNALLQMAEAGRGATLMLFHTYSGEPGNERPLESVLSRDFCLFETDAAIKSAGYPNPAGLGTFPKVLGDLVRERKLFSLENAVQRMTSKSAERFGLADRGVLAPGKAADLVVFDPETIADTPPQGAQPAGKPRGIHYVLINGRLVVKDGAYLEGTRVGRILRT